MTADHVSNLDRDWRRLVRGILPQHLRAWARSEPALAAFPEPTRLIAFLRSDASAPSKDKVLRPLVRIAREEPLAARVVLEALAPGLARLAERVIFDERDRDELWALILGHARGVALLTVANAALPLVEYSALEIKQAVVGYGRAGKAQIQQMVRALLRLDTLPQPADAADALAAAICHVHTHTFRSKVLR